MTVTYSIDRDSALSAATSVSNTFIAEYCKDAPAIYIRVYLYAVMQMQNQAFLNDDICHELGISDAELKEAFEYWQGKGLLTIVRTDPMHIEFSKVKSSYISGKNKYGELLSTLSRMLGAKSLTAADLRKIYDWIEIFGLDERVIPVLVQYCINTKGRKVSFAYIDSVAKGWADAKILTVEDANAYINRHTEYYNGALAVLNLLGKTRSPSQAEIDAYTKWRDEYHLDEETILSACSQMLSAGNPTFGYLDKVIGGYHEKGVIDAATLEKIRREQLLFEDFCKELFKRAGLAGKPSKDQRDRISVWRNEYHLADDTLMLMSEFARSDARPFAYMCKTALMLHEADILNPEDAKNAMQEKQSSKPKANAHAPGGYMRRSYTAEDLEHIGVNLDEED